MSLIEKLFGKNQYEKQIETEFWLRFKKSEGWSAGIVKMIDDQVSRLSTPQACLDRLKELQAQDYFSKVCIVAGSTNVIIACNTKPVPTFIVSGLNAANMFFLINEIKKDEKVKEYQSTWLLTMN